MKTGAGEDPFADDGDDEPVSQAETTNSTPTEKEPQPETDRARTTAASPESEGGHEQPRIPYKFRRDGVQDDRKRVPLFLHEETKQAERDAQRELEDRFGADVSLTDLREALVLAGLNHIEDAEEQLETWGYGMTFDS